MTTYARILNGVAAVIQGDAGFAATDDAAKEFWTAVPDGTAQGSRLVDDEWIAPEAQPEVHLQVVDRQTFLMLIPAHKEFAIRAFAAKTVEEDEETYMDRGTVGVILQRIDSATNINVAAPANIAAANYLQSLGLLSVDDVATILAGPLVD